MEKFNKLYESVINETSFNKETELDNNDTVQVYKDDEGHFAKKYAVQYTEKDGTIFGKGFDSDKDAIEVYNILIKSPENFKSILNDENLTECKIDIGEFYDDTQNTIIGFAVMDEDGEEIELDDTNEFEVVDDETINYNDVEYNIVGIKVQTQNGHEEYIDI